MTELILKMLTMYSICFGIMNKLPIPRRPRFLGSFLSSLSRCSYCAGTHAGYLSHTLWCLIFKNSWSGPEVIVWALIGGSSCYMIDTVMKKLEA